ncbi:MAG: hypothetical protein O3B64_00045 [bacterium]|nr:hypothetical protein [bacterium]MDA1024730.1 hypothetical protein [bacterium]
MKYVKSTIIYFIVTGALHVFALQFGWYVYVPWFDILMHFLGGGFAMLLGFVFWDIFVSAHLRRPRQNGFRFMQFIVLLGIVGLVGIAWEWYEYLLDQAIGGIRQPSIGDTMSDFFFDLTGGAVLYSIALLYERK